MKKIFVVLVFGFIAYYALWVRVLPESVSGWFSLFTIAIPVILFVTVANIHKTEGDFWLRVGFVSSVGVTWIVRDFRLEQTLGAYFLVATYLGLFLVRRLGSAERLTLGGGAGSHVWPGFQATARTAPSAPVATSPAVVSTFPSSRPPKTQLRTKAQIVKDEYHRIFGMFIQMQAVDTLTLPPGWTKKTNLYHKLIGDVDLLITSPAKNIFNVEIKAWHGVTVHNGGLAKKHDNHKPVIEAERQLWRQIYAWKDGRFRRPILWLPADTENEFFEYQPLGKKGKIIVVNGDQETLKRAIGAL